MQARDASGRQVSLLNDDAASHHYYESAQRLSYRTASHVVSRPYHAAYARSASSSPNAPDLLRSDSYDSQASNDPVSPLTPSMMYNVYPAEAHSPYDEYLVDGHGHVSSKHHAASFADNRSASYDDDAASSPSAMAPAERPGKRYPCRYRDSHGCEKTFTTSGHASRHSKIHTAEKAVHCTFPSCSKKFTRADNMKQHLETHYKDKSRSSGSRPSAAGRRSSSSAKSSSSGSSKRVDTTPLPSPGIHGGAWDLRGLNLPLLNRPEAARTHSGLDALALAVACQEGEA